MQAIKKISFEDFRKSRKYTNIQDYKYAEDFLFNDGLEPNDKFYTIGVFTYFGHYLQLLNDGTIYFAIERSGFWSSDGYTLEQLERMLFDYCLEYELYEEIK